MTQILEFGNHTITAEEIIPLLAGYHLLPQLLRELVIDQAIAPISCTPEEIATAFEQFHKNQFATEAELQTWVESYGITSEQLKAFATRKLRLEKFKQATWGHRLEAYFLTCKFKLDKVIYSLIRTKDAGIAHELFFRLQAQEQSFAELAREYSQGPETQTGGLIGPVELNRTHPFLTRMLSISQPGQIWPPTRFGEWLLIVRLEKFIPARLDAPMRQQLLNCLFEAWLSEQINQELERNGKRQNFTPSFDHLAINS